VFALATDSKTHTDDLLLLRWKPRKPGVSVVGVFVLGLFVLGVFALRAFGLESQILRQFGRVLERYRNRAGWFTWVIGLDSRFRVV
jgi:hypothetical protein